MRVRLLLAYWCLELSEWLVTWALWLIPDEPVAPLPDLWTALQQPLPSKGYQPTLGDRQAAAFVEHYDIGLNRVQHHVCVIPPTIKGSC